MNENMKYRKVMLLIASGWLPSDNETEQLLDDYEIREIWDEIKGD
jgi:hypothetical protein